MMQNKSLFQQSVSLRETSQQGVNVPIRIRGLVVLVACIMILTMMAWLVPAKAGYGTHEQMGLPPCSFLERTGYPCPTCGLTTSISAMVHGEFFLACRSHLFGVIVFFALIILSVAGAIELFIGKVVLNRLGRIDWWLAGGLIGLFGGWIVKLIWGVVSGTLPV
ncbi:MAG: DUF2752 domain-containing protein [Planctomycetes bacterium]|nr:DUF2752 domain-containing protein [Planctomycetota bacterium]